jgi:GNAT superfamily N-acetyltransferase
VPDCLVDDIEALREEARTEGFNFLERLVDEWVSGENRFNKRDEKLLVARTDDTLIGIGGVTKDPYVRNALRMRRFYVSTRFRRNGIAEKLASALIEHATQSGKLITVNAGAPSAPLFWEKMGFSKDTSPYHTHVLK